jgi:NAD(P)-dependent dehydrogenase (short-subunit alcohol dehydrogenase family)
MPVNALLVTGSSCGIGRACALLAARNGWAVAVNYREDGQAVDAVVETIAKSGGRSIAVKGDVGIEAEVLGMSDVRPRRWEGSPRSSPTPASLAPTARLMDIGAERMRRVFEVNVLGAGLTAREAARRMSRSSGGAGGSR